LTKSLTGIVSVLIILTSSFGENNPSPPKNELNKEIEKLEKLRKEIKKLIEKNRQILTRIEEEKKLLEKEKKELEKLKKEMISQRYKKLAKVFEKAVDEDPELAAERISKMKNPQKAAYIIYNMKESKAGILMDYIDPKMADEIVRVIVQIKKQNKKNNK